MVVSSLIISFLLTAGFVVIFYPNSWINSMKGKKNGVYRKSLNTIANDATQINFQHNSYAHLSFAKQSCHCQVFHHAARKSIEDWILADISWHKIINCFFRVCCNPIHFSQTRQISSANCFRSIYFTVMLFLSFSSLRIQRNIRHRKKVAEMFSPKL